MKLNPTRIALVAFFLNSVIIVVGTYRNTYDAYVHVFFADHYRSSWFSVWEPRWYTGFDVTTYPPLVHQLIALLGMVINIEWAFALLLLVTLTLFPLAVYSFARVFVGTRASFWAAALAIVLPALSLTAFTFGQLPTLFSTVFLLFALNQAYRYLASGDRFALLACVALSATSAAGHHATIMLLGPWAFAAVTARVFVSSRLPLRTWLIRLFALGIFSVGAVLIVIFPFWMWSASFAMQRPIPHYSRDGLFTNEDQRLFLGLTFGPLVPVIILSIIRAWRILPLRIAPGLFGVLFLLGLGGTTPLPALIYRSNWEWLTYDRFAFWASVVSLVFAGVLIESSEKHRLITSALLRGTFIGSMATYSLFAAFLPMIRGTQPPVIDMSPLVDFLGNDNRNNWRYLTFGFGDQWARISYLAQASTVDGSYHTARNLPELTQSGVGALDGVVWQPDGWNTANQFLGRPEKYNLRWVFIVDPNLRVRLEKFGWRELQTLANGVIVFQKPDIPPIEPRPAEPISLTGLAWGILPLLAFALALGSSGVALSRQVMQTQLEVKENLGFDVVDVIPPGRIRSIKRWAPSLIAMTICIVAGYWVYHNLSEPNTLPGTDYGQWLTFSRFYLGKTFPDYRNPLTVPPLFPALLAAFTTILEPNMAIPLVASLLFVGLGLSALMLARELFDDGITALVAMLLVTLGQTFFLDLTAFGGYLQLTAIIWMNVALFFWCRIGRGSQRIRNWIGLGVSTLLTLFSHTPTAIVFIPSTIVTFLWFWWKDKRRRLGVHLGVLACLLIPFEIWGTYLLITWDEQSGYAANRGGFYQRGMESVVSYLANNPDPALLLVALVGIFILLYLARKNRSWQLKTAATLITIWFFVPLLVVFTTYLLRVGTDYVRFVYYLVEFPLFALAFVGRWLLVRTVELRRELECSRFANLSFSQVVFRPLGLVGLTALVSWGVIATVSAYPDSVRRFSIANSPNLLQLTDWLNSHGAPSTTILSPPLESRWIEGLTGRASLADSEPYLLYRPGEIDRALAAALITSGTFAAENGYVYVRTQQVPNSVPVNPSVAAYYKGMYVDLLTLQDCLITLKTDTNGIKRKLNLDRDFLRRYGPDMVNDGTDARMTFEYYSNLPNPEVTVAKTIAVSRDSPNVIVDFKFTTTGNTRINGIDFRIADPIETSAERAIGRADVTWVNAVFGQVTVYRKEFDNSYIVGNLEFSPFPSRLMITQGTVARGEPYLESVYLMEGQTSVNVRISVMTQPMGRFRDGLRTYNIADLMTTYNVGYLVINRMDAPVQAVYDWYGYPKVYTNDDYIVYKVPWN